ncbi:type IV pilus biogenesis protein PilP [Pectobacterium aroidearum]|uniref:type IV pilus biogenesis protein PilP n=1 Tax=Pectobacterium aroidearum TaxID=1201031 RepID=UPI00211516A9|nr:type IV pilus biogenesis protein PilP [Pectobacterium aroidearum]UUE35823.1 type IV pilus biogenesis protein PilP [Pectobacterium aroidearum]UUE40197.1 type IV pilus biogenesis protein PilP [Pectobacterium aroidearum]UUE44526.1 type IV pilus biogenesis protein PilP [Pectobacterium aroidearum]UUE48746.1 type IV pilus biogenesis protein PilP [Pectobacterium aroidearum]UUE52950.1 type IV pilus biogenesis protein PilP [Pectobacterium aroidearum]
MRRNSLALLCLMVAASVYAESEIATGETESSNSLVTVGQLEDVQARNLLLAAQVESAKLQRMLKESQSPLPLPLVLPPGTTPYQVPIAPMAATMPIPTGQSTTEKTSKPVLLETYGDGKTMFARIRLASGNVIEMAKGDRLPGTTSSISAITDSSVTLSDGSQLSF